MREPSVFPLFSSSLKNVGFPCFLHRLETCRHAQLSENVIDMALDSRQSDIHLLADHSVAVPLFQIPQHDHFCRRQPFRPVDVQPVF